MVQQRWIEKYSNQKFNSEIAASSTQDFGVDITDAQNKVKFGSMNSVVISNLSDENIRITLDGTTFTELGEKGIAIIEPRDGIYFNLIRITNLSTTNPIPANKISVRWGRSDLA